MEKGQRPTAEERGYGWQWSKYRTMFLRNNPLCVVCERGGRPEPAVIVDHIQPVRGKEDPGFWDAENHQPLCFSCHEKKKARERNAANVKGN